MCFSIPIKYDESCFDIQAYIEIFVCYDRHFIIIIFDKSLLFLLNGKRTKV